jgi:hypothetical protein
MIRNNYIFINCPFDHHYSRLCNTIVLTTVSCGFIPVCANESLDVSVSRMDRIKRAIWTSKYSIHDLSRCRLSGKSRLARFNMPLELGIAIGRTFASAKWHDWAALVPEGHLYQALVSDLAGYDLLQYNGHPESLIRALMGWLVFRPDVRHGSYSVPLSPPNIAEKLPEYEARIKEMIRAYDYSREPWRLPWPFRVQEAKRVAVTIRTRSL